MIALFGASVIFLTASQAVINGPREAFRACLKEQSSRASSEKVAAGAFEAYARNACGAQLGAFKNAVIKFDMSNKMSRKASDDDADMMIDDVMASAIENYKYRNPGSSVAASGPVPATPPPTPAAAPQPPK